MTGKLIKILKLFEKNGIPAIPYKGPVLAEILYGSPSLRQFGDLDVVVHERDVLKAKDILISFGFELVFQYTAAQEIYILKTNNEYLFFHNKSNITVELHWRISLEAFSFPEDHDRLWERLCSQLLCGTKVKTFSSEDMLVILSVHGSYHLWEQIKWIADIAALLNVRPGINWRLVLKHAERLRCERMLGLGLYLSNTLLSTDLPKDANNFIDADPGVKFLSDKIIGRLFVERAKKLSLNPLHLQMWKGWRERVKLCLIVFTLSPYDFEYLRLPDRLFPLYYLIRPIHLVVKYTKKILESHRD